MHTIEELHAHYLAVRQRLNGATIRCSPKPQIKIIAAQSIEEQVDEQQRREAEAAERAVIQQAYGDVFRPSKNKLKLMEVAAKHDMTVSEMLSTNRKKKFVIARHEAMYELHMMGLSYCAIGRIINNLDHTTILHGVRRHKKRLDAQKNAEAS